MQRPVRTMVNLKFQTNSFKHNAHKLCTPSLDSVWWSTVVVPQFGTKSSVYLHVGNSVESLSNFYFSSSLWRMVKMNADFLSWTFNAPANEWLRFVWTGNQVLWNVPFCHWHGNEMICHEFAAAPHNGFNQWQWCMFFTINLNDFSGKTVTGSKNAMCSQKEFDVYAKVKHVSTKLWLSHCVLPTLNCAQYLIIRGLHHFHQNSNR